MPDTTRKTDQSDAAAKTQAIEREMERLKAIDPGSDNPETRIRLEREWDEEHPKR